MAPKTFNQNLPVLGRVRVSPSGEITINGDTATYIEFADLVAGVIRAAFIARANAHRTLKRPHSATTNIESLADI